MDTGDDRPHDADESHASHGRRSRSTSDRLRPPATSDRRSVQRVGGYPATTVSRPRPCPTSPPELTWLRRSPAGVTATMMRTCSRGSLSNLVPWSSTLPTIRMQCEWHERWSRVPLQQLALQPSDGTVKTQVTTCSGELLSIPHARCTQWRSYRKLGRHL